eukprot:CAMPEP_0185736546 /NCGR_PEP_ID=MMETSP1171-20130828/28192_1 /TAXON_ID=374046 /ORGANISM="Helicotheca tamensis, Strain CCMP826" /LENGTH=195 /DNA_ID=CAMNT_0028407197 /DNA_START=171 /DNA_END=758 /DNA_ORIENTATION=+
MWRNAIVNSRNSSLLLSTKATTSLLPSIQTAASLPYASSSSSATLPTPQQQRFQSSVVPATPGAESTDGKVPNHGNSPLDAFRDSVTREARAKEMVGRSWTVKELRRKSFEDLHSLWFVLYKEWNMLLTEANLSRRKGIVFPQPDRKRKVKKSMGAIKQVLGERKRDRVAQEEAQRLNEAEDHMDVDEEKEEEGK